MVSVYSFVFFTQRSFSFLYYWSYLSRIFSFFTWLIMYVYLWAFMNVKSSGKAYQEHNGGGGTVSIWAGKISIHVLKFNMKWDNESIFVLLICFGINKTKMNYQLSNYTITGSTLYRNDGSFKEEKNLIWI